MLHIFKLYSSLRRLLFKWSYRQYLGNSSSFGAQTADLTACLSGLGVISQQALGEGLKSFRMVPESPNKTFNAFIML